MRSGSETNDKLSSYGLTTPRMEVPPVCVGA